jgi:hypothetical protein
MLRILVSTLALLALALPALAVEPVTPGNPAPSIEGVIKNSPGAVGIFSAQSDESARHIPSGFVCPAKLPNVNLWHLQVYDSDGGHGGDVGCDYGRNKAGTNSFEAKFTIFLVKAPPAVNLDAIFKGYQDQMHASIAPLTVKTDIFQFDDQTTGHILPLLRSEGDEITLNGRKYVNELAVGIVNGWIIELRSTYPTEFVAGDRTAGIDVPASAWVWATSVLSFARGARK